MRIFSSSACSLLILATFLPPNLAAEPSVITKVERTPGGKVTFGIAPDPNSYHVLRRSRDLDGGPGRAVAIVDGTDLQSWLTDSTSAPFSALHLLPALW